MIMREFEERNNNFLADIKSFADKILAENPELLDDYSVGYLSGSDFSGKDLCFLRFVFATLNFSNFSHSQIKEANFYGAAMVETNFTGAYGENANFQKAKIQLSNFEEADLVKANFEEADLRGTDFTGANLERVNFTGADLRGANFTRANLTKADLTGAKLSGTILNQTKIKDSYFLLRDKKILQEEEILLSIPLSFNGLFSSLKAMKNSVSTKVEWKNFVTTEDVNLRQQLMLEEFSNLASQKS